MGVYIKGMEMPTSCDMCWALDDYGDYPRCRITEEQRGYNFRIREKRMDKCPLVPVQAHGRLIDADALIKQMGFAVQHFTVMNEFDEGLLKGYIAAIRVIREHCPNIIPAEGGDK